VEENLVMADNPSTNENESLITQHSSVPLAAGTENAAGPSQEVEAPLPPTTSGGDGGKHEDENPTPPRITTTESMSFHRGK
jgi:hypothetical protein